LDTLRSFMTSSALTLVMDLSFTVIYFAAMWYYSPGLTKIVLLSIPAYVILSLAITPVLKRRLDRKFLHGAANQAFLVEVLGGVETIKSSALEPQMRKRWENMLASYVTACFRAQFLGQVAGQVAGLIQKVTAGLIIVFGAHQVFAGTLSVGQLIAFNMIAGMVSSPILKLTQLWQDFQQAAISLKRLGDILNAPAESGAESSLGSVSRVKGAFSFDHVSFGYRPDAPPVVDDFTLEVEPGEAVGIVGPSGSGKSTVARLIQRLHRPDSGRILLDGTDLAMLDPYWLRRKIGFVPAGELPLQRDGQGEHSPEKSGPFPGSSHGGREDGRRPRFHTRDAERVRFPGGGAGGGPVGRPETASGDRQGPDRRPQDTDLRRGHLSFGLRVGTGHLG
jgi:subfamily B ATP-binding cassette protein HlyB/CyaB